MTENPRNVHGQSLDIMEEEKLIQAMRDRLFECRSLNKEISNQIERLERMEAKLTSLATPTLDGMPKSPSPVPDLMADSVARKVDLEEDIKRLIAIQSDERDAIERLVLMLDKAEERAVIRMRYLDCESWDDVISIMYGNQEDVYVENQKYRQRVYRYNKSAIRNLALLEYEEQQRITADIYEKLASQHRD